MRAHIAAAIAIAITALLARPSSQQQQTTTAPPAWSRVGLTVIDTAQVSGTHIDPPTYIPSNLTWQVDMHLQAAPGDVLIPLAQNLDADADRSSATFPYAECSGYVTICCLRRLERHFVNAELSAYIEFMKFSSYDKYQTCAKAPQPTEPSSKTLVDLPSTAKFARSIFPSSFFAKSQPRPRVWISNAQEGVYTIEFPDEILAEPWLTSAEYELDPIVAAQVQQQGANTDLSDVVNRLMTIRVALVQRSSSGTLALLTLSQHNIMFRAATRDLDKSATLLHLAVFAPCASQRKPPNALWRADVIHSSTTDLNPTESLASQAWWSGASNNNLIRCLWFCKPGFFLYPSATDFYHAIIVPETEANTQCLPVPAYGAEVEVKLSALLLVQIDDSVLDHTALTCAQQIQSNVTNTREVALAFLMLSLQEGVPALCGADPRASAWLLRAVSEVQEWPNVSLPISGAAIQTVMLVLDISMALFTKDLESSARIQQASTLECLNTNPKIADANSQAARSTQIQLAINARSQCAGVTLNALKVNVQFTAAPVQTRMRYPPRDEQSPTTLYYVTGAWGVVFLLFLCYGCSVMYARAHRGPVGLWRAHRIIDRNVTNL